MASHLSVFLVILFSLSPISQCRDVEREMTIEVKAGTEECFYELVKAGESIDVEYQVIDGEQGEIDINFYISGPSGNIVVHDLRKGEASHRTTMTEEADYRLCWDNTFSRFNSKTVFFGIIIESDNDDDDEDDENGIWGNGFPGVTAEEIYDMKIEDIKDALDRIRGHLSKSRFMQDQLRAYEARDRNIAENNCSKVFTWSLINITVMVVTGTIQVILLRSLFDDKSKLHRIWKKGSSSTYS